jgi:hypothetical protein
MIRSEHLQLQTNKFYEHFKNKYVNTPDFDKFKTGHIIIQSVLEIYKNNLNNKETLKQIMIILDEKLKPIPFPAPPFIEEIKSTSILPSIVQQPSLGFQKDIITPTTNEFPLQFRDTQLKTIQSNQRTPPIQNIFISIDSKDRDRTIYSAPNSWTTTLGLSREITNITEIQLLTCIILNASTILNLPYLILEIEELGSLYIGSNTDLMKGFSILTEYEIKGEFRYYKLSDIPIKQYSTPTTISKLTIKLKAPDGSIIDFGDSASTLNSTVINLIFQIAGGFVGY